MMKILWVTRCTTSCLSTILGSPSSCRSCTGRLGWHEWRLDHRHQREQEQVPCECLHLPRNWHSTARYIHLYTSWFKIMGHTSCRRPDAHYALHPYVDEACNLWSAHKSWMIRRLQAHHIVQNCSRLPRRR
jgi:hypothetical protein